MPILTVGPTSSFSSIAAAMLAAGPGDTILLETGYSNETATVTQIGMTISGDATSTGIVLHLATTPTIATVFLTGTAPINVIDAADADGNSIVGNDGDNVITVTDGADSVSGGLGNDRLIVDYHLATGAVTGDSTSNFAEAGGSRLVTITNGTFEHFTVLTGAGSDTITTGAGNDIITAGNGANTITAGQGANVITGGTGADTITALDGGNLVEAGDGTNTVTTGDGIDIISTGVGADTIVAGGGNDVITVRGGADTVNSGAQDDRLVVDYSAFTTAVIGGVTGGNLGSGYTGHIADLTVNTVDFVETENFTITTGSGNDVITTGGGIDVITTGGGNDTLLGGAGNDALNGGSGNDIAVYSGVRANYTIVQNNNATLTVTDNRGGSPDGTDTLTAIEHLQFSDQVADVFGVTINGTALADKIDVNHTPMGQPFPTDDSDFIFGMGGNDTISALGGDDFIDGGSGKDKMTGGAGDDTYIVDSDGDKVTESANGGTDTVQSSIDYILAANVEDLTLTGSANLIGTGNTLDNRINGNTGNNLLVGGAGNDILDGVSGDDTASYAASKLGVIVSLDGSAGTGGDAAGDTLFNIDNLIGSSKDDTLTGNADNNTLTGGVGDDTLNGGAGNDTFNISGSGDAADVFHGGANTDTLHVTGSSAVTLNGFDATAGSIENWVGNNDSLKGSANADTFDLSSLASVTGLAFIDAGNGNDILIGSNFNDTLRGGNGNDQLHGGAGNDTLTGGSNNDTFFHQTGNAIDTVTDYKAGQDHFDLTETSDHQFSDLNMTAINNGKDVMIDFGGGDELIIFKTTIATLSAHQGDFIFH